MNQLATPLPISQAASQSREHYRTLFHAQQQPASELAVLRTAALERFLEQGFPTQRDEDWKYTSLRRLETRAFARADAASEPRLQHHPHWIPGHAMRAVLYDGCWTPQLSGTLPQPPGITLLGLGQWVQHNPEEVANFLRHHAPQGAAARGTAFEHLNQAFANDGVIIEIAAETVCEVPLYILHHWQTAGLMSHPRIIVRAGHNSRCTLIEHYVGNSGESFTNALTTIEAAPGAQLIHYRVQQEATQAFHIGHTHVNLAADAAYTQYELALGASLSRVATQVRLQGQGASATLSGLIMPGGNQHLDTFTCIEHAAGHTVSRELYRGIADGRGRAVFRGKVIVHPGAQHIDAQQSNRNLLLAATAEIDTRPELEIYANDVKCSHGATTGQLDATALFYLRSRGLSAAQARATLIRAFAAGFLNPIQHPVVAQFIEAQLAQRFANFVEAA